MMINQSQKTNYHTFSAAELSRNFSAPTEQVRDLPEFNPLDYILQEPLTEESAPSHKSQNTKLNGVRFVINGNLINFQQSQSMQTIQDIYMRVINDKLFFSTDGDKWLPFDELFALDCYLNFPIDDASENTEITVNFEVNTLV